jgi:type I restriction enzyme S subunit
MRSHWNNTTLGEIATLTMGRTPPRNAPKYWTEDLEHPFCTIADMTSKFVFPKREGITSAAIRDGKAKVAPKGTLLMSFKLTIGRMGFAGRDIYPNEAIVSILPESGTVLDLFLYYLLGSQDLTADAGRAIKGETLNSKSLAAIPILLPPLEEQKRIVEVMSSVDDVISATTQAFMKTKNLRSALLSDLLSGEHEIPVSYDSFVGQYDSDN